MVGTWEGGKGGVKYHLLLNLNCEMHKICSHYKIKYKKRREKQ